MRKVIFGLLFLLFPYSAYSATVKGKVTDKNTGEHVMTIHEGYLSLSELEALIGELTDD